MADAQSPLAPTPQFPERAPTEFQRKGAPSPVGNQGPVRFEEGLATDPDVPVDFVTGIVQGNSSAPGRPNRNANVFEKPAEETMKERAHAGSASWVEAPTLLQDFVQGSFTDYAAPRFEEVIRDGGHQDRPTANQVRD